ncbi:hypothetical protein SAMN05444173_1301 [Opitutus sp. GAS368]|nr:hypothetical protein SAMN05444173_1301 [Opitutus sp. GAS368]
MKLTTTHPQGRPLPGAGQLNARQLSAISHKSCRVPKAPGPPIPWSESFVTDDKIYRVYLAPDEAPYPFVSAIRSPSSR